MDLSRIPIGENPPHEVNVVIEIPQGGAPVKYEIDKESGAMFVDRFLHTAMFYPANYGFIMEDEAGIDEKVLAVPVDRLHPFYRHVTSHRDLPEILLQQIEHFFTHYKDLEKGKWVKVRRWAEPLEAADLIRAGIARAQAK